MTGEEMSERVRRYVEAFTAQDWAACRDLLADDAVYEEEATRRRVVGAGAILDALRDWKRAYPDLRGTLREPIAGADALVVEVAWEGTHQGELRSPFGLIPPTGRRGRLVAAQVYRFGGDGRIRELHHYFDLLTMLAQIDIQPWGLAPPPRVA